MIGGDSSKTRLVMKKRKKLTPGISTSLTPDYREKRRTTCLATVSLFNIGTRSQSVIIW